MIEWSVLVMKYEICRPGRLKVIITPNEMNNLSLSFDCLDYSKTETRSLILKLLNEARDQTGFEISESCMFVEAIPSADGGCVLYFTGQENKLFKNKKDINIDKQINIYSFKDAEIMINVMIMLNCASLHKYALSDLYEYNGNYILLISSEETLPECFYSILDEFGEYKDKDTISPSVLSEHAKLLAKDNASEIISGYFNTDH